MGNEDYCSPTENLKDHLHSRINFSQNLDQIKQDATIQNKQNQKTPRINSDPSQGQKGSQIACKTAF